MRLESQLQRGIGHLRRPLPRRSRKADLTREYAWCKWWAGCCYCQDFGGAWHLIYCVGFVPARDPFHPHRGSCVADVVRESGMGCASSMY